MELRATAREFSEGHTLADVLQANLRTSSSGCDEMRLKCERECTKRDFKEVLGDDQDVSAGYAAGLGLGLTPQSSWGKPDTVLRQDCPNWCLSF